MNANFNSADRELLVRLDQKLSDKIQNDSEKSKKLDENFRQLFEFHNKICAPAYHDVRWMRRLLPVNAILSLLTGGKVGWDTFK